MFQCVVDERLSLQVGSSQYTDKFTPWVLFRSTPSLRCRSSGGATHERPNRETIQVNSHLIALYHSRLRPRQIQIQFRRMRNNFTSIDRNEYTDYCKNHEEYCDKLKVFLQKNLDYMLEMSEKYSFVDPFWHHVSCKIPAFSSSTTTEADEASIFRMLFEPINRYTTPQVALSLIQLAGIEAGMRMQDHYVYVGDNLTPNVSTVM